MKILLSGGTGFVGRELGIALVRSGHQLVIVTRSREKALRELPYPAEIVECDLTVNPLPQGAVGAVDAVVHLMGENISDGRWTPERKRRLYDSRVASTRNLVESMAGQKLSVWISASAVGYYGDRGDEVLNETSREGHDFLAELCRNWELELKNSEVPWRKVIFRFGLVLSPFDGVVRKMVPLFRANIGGRLGSGQQWMSWIHITDLVKMISVALTDEKWNGPINAVSPEPVTNATWTRGFVRELEPAMAPPAPKAALRLALGELSEALLSSQRVEPAMLKSLRFPFQFPDWQKALDDVLSPYRDHVEAMQKRHFLKGSVESVFARLSRAQEIARLSSSKNVRLIKVNPPQSGVAHILYHEDLHRLTLEHTLELTALPQGTLLTDTVQYRPPFGWLGAALAGPWLSGDVEKMFDLRQKHLSDLNFTAVDR